ncbi:three-Cys-motif partner protein TcmP [Actinomadura graeca]|uniref:Three-Cys-motif partner protein TcmP n=1 Tax=Actinomadura graeca TaxID=2750812 RepID=A0ABX8QUW5_9ACTN|nr:three-Cys-motif partner protein TcmP [Actinomadura graeca]QXJ22530.1 three-Cys-motif partner protein TcmP [Actinomadura graeca]
MARDWGWWTEQKLDILSDYLAGFSKASIRAKQTVYLDLFAGQAENVSREPSRHTIQGSPKRALAVDPPLSVLRFFELPNNAQKLENSLRAAYPQRDLKVIPGDCNETIDDVLTELTPLNWAPTFAFLDQQSTEVEWPTLVKLARHKRQDKPKTELWLLCASGLIPRGLRIRGNLDPGVVSRTNEMFGTDEWFDALEATQNGILSGPQFEHELTNLMRWRMERVLGYRKTRAFRVMNTNGRDIFEMIFATDHDAGDKIMKWSYEKAQRQQPALRLRAKLSRLQAKEEERGEVGLFDAASLAPDPAPHGYTVVSDDKAPHSPFRGR